DSVGFSVVFLASQVGVNVLGRSAYSSTRLSRLGILDQFGGLLIGLILTFALVSITATVLKVAVNVSWAGADAVRSPIAETATVSALMPMFLAAVPSFAETVRPWLPAPLPAIFFL
ncbi:MAG: hypothetical protein Q7O66_08700, partial [Dehalococcoidia bacterium]|nr:hypothetical protein [Dehalococcoidia bacterium]